MRSFIIAALSMMILLGAICSTSYSQSDPVRDIRMHCFTINKNLHTYHRVTKQMPTDQKWRGLFTALLDDSILMLASTTLECDSIRGVNEFYYWQRKLICVLQSEYTPPISTPDHKVVMRRRQLFFSNDSLIRWIDYDGGIVPMSNAFYRETANTLLARSREYARNASSSNRRYEYDPLDLFQQ